jgi:hypothetical protein
MGNALMANVCLNKKATETINPLIKRRYFFGIVSYRIAQKIAIITGKAA